MDPLDIFLKQAAGAAEMLAALTGFFCWRKIKHTYWKWFPVYLLVIALAENITMHCTTWGRYLEEKKVYPYIIVPLEFIFFIWLFSKQFVSRAGKLWCLVALVIYVAAFAVDQHYFAGHNYWFHSFSYSAGNIILLALIIAYLVRFAKGGEVIHFKVNMMFWVCLGLIFFYLGTFPFFGFINTLYRDHIDIFYPYMRITFILNILMYLLFTIGFVWIKKK